MGSTDREYDVATGAPEYACQRCNRRLSRRGETLECPNCATSAPIIDGIPRFPVPDAAGESSSEGVFDRLAPIYETPLWFRPLYRFVGGPGAPRDDRERLASLLDLDLESTADADQRVLDVACGTGRFTRYVAPDVGSVVGVDISTGMLERARRYASRDGIENVSFARMSADDLWLEADAFDRAVCSWALHLLPDVDAVLAELHRVLRSGGRFVGGVLVDAFVLDLPPVRAVARGALDAEPFDVDDLRTRLRAAGFSNLEFDRRGAALFFRADAA